MAQFEGVIWADRQMRFSLPTGLVDYVPVDDKVFAVSRSVHYSLFLAFEGIRFACRVNENGHHELVFLNWHRNLERFQRSMSFNLGRSQQAWVPSTETLVRIFIDYFRHPELADFLTSMARDRAQGYLRPFTIDEEQSIGVTFPNKPAIRAVFCRYNRYLGEPFNGVVVPYLVRAVGLNGTGCLKLGVNYLMSVKSVDLAKTFDPAAASALFLDDQTHISLRDRVITEWDSSCCLIALRDGTVVKIPESPLILPSVTIKGIVSILRKQGVNVEERNMTYGELIDRSKAREIVTISSVGTAGIINRADKLTLVGENNDIIGEMVTDKKHELFQVLGTLKETYWGLFFKNETGIDDLCLFHYDLDMK